MSRKEPQVIAFVIGDSLRYDTSNPYLDQVMPYISGRATHFHQVRSPGCWTLPSHASMFTGKWLHEHGQNTQMRKAGHSFPMLAEILEDRGYYNLMVTSNVVVTDIFGLNRGFNETRKIWKEIPDQKMGWLYTMLGYLWRPRLRKRFINSFVNKKMAQDLESLRVFFNSYARQIFELSRRRISDLLERNQKVFLFINLYDLHFPYHTADKFHFSRQGFGNRRREFKVLMDIINNQHMKTERYQPDREIVQSVKQRQVTAFRRVGKMADEFFEWLREKEENSTLIFSSDHGENFGEENWLYHFANVTEGGNRVPLLWSAPGQDHREDVQGSVNLKDVFGGLLYEGGVKHNDARPVIDIAGRNPSIIEAFWYDAKGRTVNKYKRNQFAFIGKEKKHIYRKGQWLEAPLNRDLENDEPGPAGVSDPIKESGLDARQKKTIRKGWEEFLRFEKTVSY